MALDFLKFIIIVNLIVFSTSEETCEKKDVCSCTFKDGSIVDLRPVDNPKGPRFTGIEGTSGRKFDWNPCTPFVTTNGCSDTLVCQVVSDGDKNVGSKDTTFSVNSEGNVVIAYGGFKDTTGYTRKSAITLKCDPSAPGYGIIPKFTETNPAEKTSLYNATFTSKYACPKGGSNSSGGLSVGSILLIIFFPLVLMYVVIGILVNRYGRGIESMPELFPNHSFWADFPFLVKDGVLFTFGCIKSACSSLSQKCGKDGYAEI